MALESSYDATDSSREDDFLYYLHRGSELMKTKRPEEARTALERAFQISPGNPKAQNLLGLVYFKLGLLEAAKSIYDRLVEEYPSEAPLYVNLGLVLLRQGRLTEAERALKKAIAIAPEHTRAHCYLGLVFYRRGDLALAREHFVKGQADEFARKVEARLSQGSVMRPSQAEMLRQVAENGFRDLESAAMPFKQLDVNRDERIVRDEEAWEAWVPHDRERDGANALGIDVNSLLPVWNLTPLPAPYAELEQEGRAEVAREPHAEVARARVDRLDEATPVAAAPSRLAGRDAPREGARLRATPPVDPLRDTAPVLGSPWHDSTPQLSTLARAAEPLEIPPLADARDRFPESRASAMWSGSPEAVNAAREKLAFPALAALPVPVPIAPVSIAPMAVAPMPIAPVSIAPMVVAPVSIAPVMLESGDLPGAMQYGDQASTDILSEVKAVLSEAPPATTGYHAGPGARARLWMESRAYLKASTIVAASGKLSMTPARSQLQGRATATTFGDASDPMCLLEGRASVMIRVPRVAVALRGVRDLHVVASALMGFDDGFGWDNGKILGLEVVTLRGSGSLLLDTRGAPMLIPVDAETPVHAAIDAILAWSDGVRPSPLEGAAGGNGDARLFRLRGHGYVLVAFPPEAKT